MHKTSLALVVVLGLFSPVAGQESGEAGEISERPLTPADRDHWSFQPLVRPEVPAVTGETPMALRDWPRNPIDHFILARLEAEGLSPMPEASRQTLIRRVTFDLTGLPPTPEEVDAFLADESPDAYERLIERLLASPAYGERWAQHWLDLARFAETDGFEHDHVRPEAWRYRDWVIDALNRDVPYDEFVQLQLAGDELRPGDEWAAVATGFVLCGPDMPDINLPEERRHMVLSEITGTVGSVFLSLQIGCAQCHDHKYDPISQADFYRLEAFFANVDLFAEHPFGRVLHESDAEAPAAHLMIRGDFRRPGPEVQPAFPRIANPWGETVRRDALQRVEGPPGTARQGGRGQSEPAGGESEAPAEPPASSGLRTALARWLTRPDHPLTTRVIVNRLWQHHFGHGLVRTPSDFGLMGDLPTHPELLDWLATEFTRGAEQGTAGQASSAAPSGAEEGSGCGWSLKAMHRLMLTSATYRQASRPSEAGWSEEQRAGAAASWRRSREQDPENYLLARMNRIRLDGEAIRDSMLAASDRLSERRGGPGVRPPLPEELVATLLANQWEVSPDEEDHRRRSIYLFVRRNLRYPLFDLFDRPDTNASCPRRAQSTTAPQMLALMNSELSLSAARDLAGFVLVNAGGDVEAQVDLAYRRALGRTPMADELDPALRFLERQAERLGEEGRPADQLALPRPLPEGVDPYRAAALTDFCLALFNLNEFLYLD